MFGAKECRNYGNGISLELTRKKQEYNDIMSGVSTGTTKDTKVNMPLPARKADADEQ